MITTFLFTSGRVMETCTGWLTASRAIDVICSSTSVVRNLRRTIVGDTNQNDAARSIRESSPRIASAFGAVARKFACIQESCVRLRRSSGII